MLCFLLFGIVWDLDFFIPVSLFQNAVNGRGFLFYLTGGKRKLTELRLSVQRENQRKKSEQGQKFCHNLLVYTSGLEKSCTLNIGHGMNFPIEG